MIIPDMRITPITYRELLQELSGLTAEQLNCNVTVQNGAEEECYQAELRIIREHDTLDEDHPVIYHY